ncbi:hypothetical protein [Nocardia wallacei]|uniref:hypothetical protein n=1 Tax=Nocardia wallacei TaxID=480035 RepID=UPI002458368C|nr:hypothetical protein [Nocardia wallacei]
MIRYLSLKEFAERTGLAYSTVKAYWHRPRPLLPPPDAQVGENPPHVGWLPETVDNWERPGRGARRDLRDKVD